MQTVGKTDEISDSFKRDIKRQISSAYREKMIPNSI